MTAPTPKAPREIGPASSPRGGAAPADLAATRSKFRLKNGLEFEVEHYASAPSGDALVCTVRVPDADGKPTSDTTTRKVPHQDIEKIDAL